MRQEINVKRPLQAVALAALLVCAGCAASPPEFVIAEVKIDYVFRSDAEFDSAEAASDNKVFALPSLRHGEKYDLYPLSCANGLPPFVVVDVFHTDEATDRRLFQRIRDRNAALFSAGKIDLKYGCTTS